MHHIYSKKNLMYRTILLKFLNIFQGNGSKYRLMVSDISNGVRLTAWFSYEYISIIFSQKISTLSNSVTEIKETHHELISAIFSYDWFKERQKSEITAYANFLIHLNIAGGPTFFVKTYEAILKSFRGPPKISLGLLLSFLNLFIFFRKFQ